MQPEQPQMLKDFLIFKTGEGETMDNSKESLPNYTEIAIQQRVETIEAAREVAETILSHEVTTRNGEVINAARDHIQEILRMAREVEQS